MITGLSGTGKTTFGRKLAKDLSLPFISKDDFKEILFDELGCKDRAWSEQLGGASYDILYKVAEEIISSGNSLIIETNFDPKTASVKITKLQQKFGFNIFQIRFFTDGEVLFERFKQRALSGERHKGHCDGENLEHFKESLLAGKIAKLDLEGEFLDIDTTEFEKVDCQRIADKIKKAMNKYIE